MNADNNVFKLPIKGGNYVKIQDVPHDGSCLFHSIVYGIHDLIIDKKNKININAKKLRNICVDQLKIKINNFKNSNNQNSNYITGLLLEKNPNINTDLLNKKQQIQLANKYANELKGSNVWAGDYELSIVSPYIKFLGFKGIRVYNSNSKTIIDCNVLDISKPYPIIYIYYDKNHYQKFQC